MAVGGEDDKVVLRSVETFDPNTLTWKPLACLPFAISKHGLVSVGKAFSCNKLKLVWGSLQYLQ